MKIAILASGLGTTFEHLLLMRNMHNPPVHIDLLITDNPKAGAILVAKRNNIKYLCISPKDFDDFSKWDHKMAQTLVESGCDYVLLLGFLKMIGPEVLRQFGGRLINSHPSLLPKYGGKGMYGRKVHQAVIENGEKETGVTLHFVNDSYDKGEIIKQVKLPIRPNETAEMLEARVKELEKKTWVDFVNNWTFVKV